MIDYEWDIEEVDPHGDIVDHHFLDGHPDGLAPEHERSSEGWRYDLVLVRTTYSNPETRSYTDRSWAYVRNGKLPEMFEDAYQIPVHKIPKRFYDALNKVI